MNKLKAFGLLGLAAVFFVITGATLAALIFALRVENTLAAVESAFGSLVIALGCLALGVKSFRAGKARLKAEGS